MLIQQTVKISYYQIFCTLGFCLCLLLSGQHLGAQERAVETIDEAPVAAAAMKAQIRELEKGLAADWEAKREELKDLTPQERRRRLVAWKADQRGNLQLLKRKREQLTRVEQPVPVEPRVARTMPEGLSAGEQHRWQLQEDLAVARHQLRQSTRDASPQERRQALQVFEYNHGSKVAELRVLQAAEVTLPPAPLKPKYRTLSDVPEELSPAERLALWKKSQAVFALKQLRAANVSPQERRRQLIQWERQHGEAMREAISNEVQP